MCSAIGAGCSQSTANKHLPPPAVSANCNDAHDQPDKRSFSGLHRCVVQLALWWPGHQMLPVVTHPQARVQTTTIITVNSCFSCITPLIVMPFASLHFQSTTRIHHTTDYHSSLNSSLNHHMHSTVDSHWQQHISVWYSATLHRVELVQHTQVPPPNPHHASSPCLGRAATLLDPL